ncbi:peptidylprolyl isomerase [Oceanirhabdus sp. W0125-5]|uniref:peptidylprolyl isomerase n=1 Tax=Oceanirhabdus sp. W0125-5 TaxID=2999116 RepID=UPI0022F3399B|nr:peptidylprolyl isomerase [Oceanirhabdus sp. W0125-5]WBW99079.1 peptidylprolyl isomerase [Oceanirhabdus sp. W0125-5]
MKHPIVTITMRNRKKIKIELYPEFAPNTVNNFIYLIKEKFFDNMAFVRVVNGRLIQAGDPNMPGPERTDVSPGYIINGEFNKENYHNPLSFKSGVVGMAMADYEYTPNASAGSFFIMTKDESKLDSIVPAFGKVIEGMDVIIEINKSNTSMKYGYDVPDVMEYFENVTVDTFDTEYPKPEKIYE